MRLLTLAFLCIALAPPARSAELNQLTAAERRDGWHLLFNGETTEGWEEITGKPFPTSWTIEDHCLKALVRKDGWQDIRTIETFRSFDLQFDWKMGKHGNSGVKYLVQKVDEWTNQAGRQARARGPEYQLAGDENDDAASDPRRLAASLYSLITPSPRTPPLIDAFNHSRILVQGHHVEHWLNGVKVVVYDSTDPALEKAFQGVTPHKEESPISLQNHSSETWFRNIKIRVLK